MDQKEETKRPQIRKSREQGWRRGATLAESQAALAYCSLSAPRLSFGRERLPLFPPLQLSLVDRRMASDQPVQDLNGECGDLDDVEEGGYLIGDVYVPPPPPLPAFSGEQTGRRLVITHITNINFKSYAGERVLGPFHKSFTSIVGPNGSGKSNVIDAMLFVFGYRAQKLRSKKLSVLIHNSDTYPDLTSCEVKVHFALIDDQGGEDYDIVEGSQFTISRTANKDNSSSYYITQNESTKRVQFKEVAKKLQSHGIDLRYNRFLILQGEVEQIALMKPKAETEHDIGMLEFLEDIIGCNRLKEPLAKLQEKVEKLNELRSEKLNRVKVVEKEKTALEGPMQEAIQYLESQNALARTKCLLFQKHCMDLSEKAKEAESVAKEAEDKWKSVNSESEELAKERETLQSKLSENEKELTHKVQEAEDRTKEFRDFEKRDIQTLDQIKHTKGKGKRLLEELEKEKDKLEELKQLPPKLTEEVEATQNKRTGKETELRAAEEQLTIVMNEIKKDTQTLQEEKDEFEQQLLSMQQAFSDATSKRDLAQNEHDLYISAQQKERAKMEQLQFKLDSGIRELGGKKSALDKFKSSLPTLEKELNAIASKVTSDSEKKEANREKLRSLRSKESEARNRANQSRSRNKVLTALIDQKRKGKLNGVLGRLGDLGTIPAKYDVAVSTACSRLDNIVTESIDDAQACVQFLKDNNIGTATFIGLDKIPKADWNRFRGAPENCPRLFDLIDVNEERVRAAFYFALSDTIVANDLDQATRVSQKQRIRIVTLQGQMVETSGAMSGGGRPMKGRMGTQTSAGRKSDVLDEDQLQNLRDEMQSLEHEIEEIDERSRDLHRKQEQLTKELQTLKENAPRLEMEIETREKQLETLKSELKEAELRVKNAEPDPSVTKELKDKLDEALKAYAKEQAKTESVQSKINDINSKIKEAVDKRIGGAKSLISQLKKEMSKLDEELAKKSASLKTAERNMSKSQSKIQSLEQEVASSMALIEQLKAERLKIEEEAAGVVERKEEAIKAQSELHQQVLELRKRMSALSEKEVKLNEKNLDAKLEYEKVTKLLGEKQSQVAEVKEQIAAIELQSIPGKEVEPLPQPTEEEIADLDIRKLKSEIENFDKQIKAMKPNMAAIEEFRKKADLYLERFSELTAATEARDHMKSQFEQLRVTRLSEFRAGFLNITRKLKEMYRTITNGGDAELEWADSLDPFSEGVLFSVRPNKKSWKRISNLSGGEKTLASLALIFALHYYKPSPLYVMDEIDAALDFANVSIVGHYIKQRTGNTQFIIISLRNNMYELADRLVGIYKTHNCTKSVSLSLAGWREGGEVRG